MDDVKNAVVLDTNIIIDFLQGHHRSKLLFDSYKESATKIVISIITVIEVLVGILDADKQKTVGQWLQSYQTIMVCPHIAYMAISLRQIFKLKVPDALIMATAKQQKCILVTRDRDFLKIPGVHYPYTLL